MAGGVGHTGGLTNPRPWRGRCRAGFSNTGGPPLPQKRAPLQKKKKEARHAGITRQRYKARLQGQQQGLHQQSSTGKTRQNME